MSVSGCLAIIKGNNMTKESNFKLDTRIKSIADIQTIICNNPNFIGYKGFFFDEFVKTKDLTKSDYGTLVDINIVDNDDHCFKARDENGREFIGYYRFFIPEDALNPKEKKYRPLTDEEFLALFDSGKLHSIRQADGKGRYIITDIYFSDSCGKDEVYVCFDCGDCGYEMEYLLKNNFEYLDGDEWKRFGVEE